MHLLLLKLLVPYCTFVDLLKFQELNSECYHMFRLNCFWNDTLRKTFHLISDEPLDEFKNLYLNSFKITPKKKSLLIDYFQKKKSKKTWYNIVDNLGFDIEKIKRLFKFHSKGVGLNIKIFELCFLDVDNEIHFCKLTLYSNILTSSRIHTIDISINKSDDHCLLDEYYKNVTLDVQYECENVEEFQFAFRNVQFKFIENTMFLRAINIDSKVGVSEHRSKYFTVSSGGVMILDQGGYYLLCFENSIERYETIQDLIMSIKNIKLMKCIVDIA